MSPDAEDVVHAAGDSVDGESPGSGTVVDHIVEDAAGSDEVHDAGSCAGSCVPAGTPRSSLCHRYRRSALAVPVHNPSRGHNSVDEPRGWG